MDVTTLFNILVDIDFYLKRGHGCFLIAVCQEYFVDFQWGFAINKATVTQLSTLIIFLRGF